MVRTVLGAPEDAKMYKICDCPLAVHTLEIKTLIHPQLQREELLNAAKVPPSGVRQEKIREILSNVLGGLNIGSWYMLVNMVGGKGDSYREKIIFRSGNNVSGTEVKKRYRESGRQ